MGDPYAVVFHLPSDFHNHSPQFPGTEIGRGPTITTTEELGVTDKLVKHIMLQIRGYLVDSNVQIIEMASRTLKVIIIHNLLKIGVLIDSCPLFCSLYFTTISCGVVYNIVYPQGLLATERGHCVLRSMTSTESAYLEVIRQLTLSLQKSLLLYIIYQVFRENDLYYLLSSTLP